METRAAAFGEETFHFAMKRKDYDLQVRQEAASLSGMNRQSGSRNSLNCIARHNRAKLLDKSLPLFFSLGKISFLLLVGESNTNPSHKLTLMESIDEPNMTESIRALNQNMNSTIRLF